MAVRTLWSLREIEPEVKFFDQCSMVFNGESRAHSTILPAPSLSAGCLGAVLVHRIFLGNRARVQFQPLGMPTTLMLEC